MFVLNGFAGHMDTDALEHEKKHNVHIIVFHHIPHMSFNHWTWVYFPRWKHFIGDHTQNGWKDIPTRGCWRRTLQDSCEMQIIMFSHQQTSNASNQLDYPISPEKVYLRCDDWVRELRPEYIHDGWRWLSEAASRPDSSQTPVDLSQILVVINELKEIHEEKRKKGRGKEQKEKRVGAEEEW